MSEGRGRVHNSSDNPYLVFDCLRGAVRCRLKEQDVGRTEKENGGDEM